MVTILAALAYGQLVARLLDARARSEMANLALATGRWRSRFGAHFVKMVHDGIEYRLMAACAEGINIPLR